MWYPKHGKQNLTFQSTPTTLQNLLRDYQNVDELKQNETEEEAWDKTQARKRPSNYSLSLHKPYPELPNISRSSIHEHWVGS